MQGVCVAGERAWALQQAALAPQTLMLGLAMWCGGGEGELGARYCCDRCDPGLCQGPVVTGRQGQVSWSGPGVAQWLKPLPLPPAVAAVLRIGAGGWVPWWGESWCAVAGGGDGWMQRSGRRRGPCWLRVVVSVLRPHSGGEGWCGGAQCLPAEGCAVEELVGWVDLPPARLSDGGCCGGARCLPAEGCAWQQVQLCCAALDGRG